MKNNNYRCAMPVLVVAAIMVSAMPALAHKVNVFAYVDGDTVRAESYFPDGKACVNGKILVQSPEGVTLLEGITDEDGMFSFEIPQKTDLTIVIEAGMGHRGEFKLAASELPDVIAPEKKPLAVNDRHAGEEDHDHEIAEIDASIVIPAECREFLAPMIQDEIDTRVARIMAETGWRPRRGVSTLGILGGVGYIIGFMGLWMFYVSRKKDRE